MERVLESHRTRARVRWNSRSSESDALKRTVVPSMLCSGAGTRPSGDPRAPSRDPPTGARALARAACLAVVTERVCARAGVERARDVKDSLLFSKNASRAGAAARGRETPALGRFGHSYLVSGLDRDLGE